MNGSAQTGVLVAIGVVVVSGIFGASYSKDSAIIVLGFCGTICTALLGLLQQMRVEYARDKDAKEAKELAKTTADKLDKAAEKVEEVKQTLTATTSTQDAKLDEMSKVGTATHALVNSNMGTALKLNSVVSRRLADLTKDTADITAADLADKLLAEHVAKQAMVDAKDAKDAKE